MNELEPIPDVTLIRYKQQATVLSRLRIRSFVRGNFRAERDTAANDALGLGGESMCLEVPSRVRLSQMRREGAALLGLLVVGESVIEVAVPVGVGAESIVVSCGSDVDGCTCWRS